MSNCGSKKKKLKWNFGANLKRSNVVKSQRVQTKFTQKKEAQRKREITGQRKENVSWKEEEPCGETWKKGHWKGDRDTRKEEKNCGSILQPMLQAQRHAHYQRMCLLLTHWCILSAAEQLTVTSPYLPSVCVSSKAHSDNTGVLASPWMCTFEYVTLIAGWCLNSGNTLQRNFNIFSG